jgi:hypothetical protein
MDAARNKKGREDAAQKKSRDTRGLETRRAAGCAALHDIDVVPLEYVRAAR